MTASGLRDSQMAMARYLRNPDTEPPPQGVEPRRLKIYRELIYNNLERFIASGFPVLRSLYRDEDWHQMVQSFIEQHQCRTPYFLEISQEFLKYLLEVHQARACDPPFLAALAHYEWVELALDVSEEEHPQPHAVSSPLDSRVLLSPLAWVLSYPWPVHLIGPGFRPEEPGGPWYLLVYRDLGDEVRFMELNSASARLLELIRDQGEYPVGKLLLQLGSELQTSGEQLEPFAVDFLQDLERRGIIAFRGVPPGVS